MTIRQYPAPPTFKDAVAEIRRRQAERASEMTFEHAYAEALAEVERMNLDAEFGILEPPVVVPPSPVRPKPPKLSPVSIENVVKAGGCVTFAEVNSIEDEPEPSEISELGLPPAGPVAGEDDPEVEPEEMEEPELDEPEVSEIEDEPEDEVGVE